MDITLTPIRGQGNEANWLRCSKQLRAAGVSEKDINAFAFTFGWHNGQATRTGRAIETAAELCGYEVRWIDAEEEEEEWKR